jgi:hypothetical protein
MDQRQPSHEDRLRQLVNGYQVTQAIYVAVTVGLPDLLAGERRSPEELAAETRTHPGSLYRLMRALAATGVLTELPDGDGRSFELTELGHLLRSDAPGSLADWAAYVARPHHWESWGDLLHTVRTGEGAFAARHPGESVWEWRRRHPEENEVFNRAMHALSATTARRLADGYDFGRFSTLADLGGGDGSLLAAVLVRHPRLRGVLFDLPHVVADAGSTLEKAGVADRCEISAGSFFDHVPAGCEAYLLKSILHDWDDASSLRILEQVRDAAGPETALLIVERTLDEHRAGAVAAMSDLNMMVMTGGAERTITEWRTLTDACSFELTGTVDIGGGWSVIEARRV